MRIVEYQRDRRPGGYSLLPDCPTTSCRNTGGMTSGARSDSCAGAGARPQRRGGDRAGAQGRQVPASGVSFLPRHPEPGEDLWRSGAPRLDRACQRALCYALCSYRRNSEHAEAGLGGGARAAAVELPYPRQRGRQPLLQLRRSQR